LEEKKKKKKRRGRAVAPPGEGNRGVAGGNETAKKEGCREQGPDQEMGEPARTATIDWVYCFRLPTSLVVASNCVSNGFL